MKLFEPIQIGPLELKNRIVMPPMVTNFGSDTGAVTERLVDYHVERAKGMVGLIIVEATCVEGLLGRLVVNQLRVDSDKYLPGLADLVESVHLHGAKIALQIHHAGRQTTLEATEGRIPVSPSEVPYIDMYTSPGSVIAQPRSLTIQEIGGLVEKFGEGARRAKTAGFDAVEIHGAHGYLIGQFLSPYTNKRNDEYGGSFERRMQFALEVIERVRKEVGSNYPLSFRISADEYIESGMTLELAKRVAVKLEGASVNVIHVSGSLGESNHMCEAPMAIRRGFNVHLAEGIKKVVSIPVIAVGRINDPELAEKILQERKADLVAMGRALIADPQLPMKAMEGKFDEVRKCIACDLGCSSRLYLGLCITCNVNPDVGKEREFRLTRAEKVKEVLIVGGGLAGMEAARVATLRGHRVTLCEKTDELGGQLLLATRPPHKEELQNILDYLRIQMGKLKVEIELRKTIRPEIIDEEKPDAVVVATGAVPLIPRIPGIESKRVVTAWDVLAGKVDPKDEIAIVGGGEVGCETAEYLTELGRNVTLVEALGDLALDMEPLNRYLLLQRLKEREIKVHTGTMFKEVTNEGIVVGDAFGEHVLRAESIILSLGTVPDNALASSLRGKVEQLYVIGDCVKPRRTLEAIHEGSWAARQV
jgi:2,4-dienoyl-CoA reductase-like NADH-dependent reductase (Old Yellow Enzyme family)/thioredoxin reductase